jgi:hypothetical protein
MFVRPAAAAAGNIFEIRGAGGPLLTLGLNSDAELTLDSEPFGLECAAHLALTLDGFHHVLLRFSGGTAYVYADGELAFSAEMTPSVTLEATEARLGGFDGQIDEFLFKHSAGAGAPVPPSQPYQGVLKAADVGGFGDGAFGDETVNTAGVQINTYAMVAALVDAKTLVIGSQNHGMYGALDVGNEVMVHASLKRGSAEADLGKYSLRRIAALDGNAVILDRPVDEFQISSGFLADYRVQILSVPNYNNLTVTTAGVVVPLAWSETFGGGIVALKCRGEMKLNGKIITVCSVPKRTDSLALTHSQIVDNFVLTGNAFIVAREFSARVDARIGGDWDGSRRGGACGEPTGLLYDYMYGSAGFVGKGGNGGLGGYNQSDAGGTDDLGGKPGMPGTGGINGPHVTGSYQNPGKGEDGRHCAANVIIIAKILECPDSVVSTGGGGGGGGGYSDGNSSAGGGGGAFLGQGHKSSHNLGGDGADATGTGTEGQQIQYPSSLQYGDPGHGGGAGYGGGGGAAGRGGRGGGASGTGFAYIAAEVLLAA